jgi:ankyrin repeat protein
MESVSPLYYLPYDLIDYIWDIERRRRKRMHRVIRIYIRYNFCPLFGREFFDDIFLLNGKKRVVGIKTDMESRKRPGHTLLHHAVCDNKKEVVRLLLDEGTFVDQASRLTGLTPLHEASRRGYVGMIKLLLDSGADIHAEPRAFRRYVMTYGPPLKLAIEDNRFKTAKYLLSRGANPNLLFGGNRTCLHIASGLAYGYRFCLLLLKAGAYCDIVDTDGFTPFKKAKRNGRHKSAELIQRFSSGRKNRSPPS